MPLMLALGGAFFAWGFGGHVPHAPDDRAAPDVIPAAPGAHTAADTLDESPAVEGLAQGIMRAIGTRALRGTTCGIKIYNLAAGKSVFAYHATTPLTPASTMKLLTSSAALSLYVTVV